MTIRPIGDRIVVKPLEAEAKTTGGIILPDTAKEKQLKGEVVAVGTGRVLENGKRYEIELKVGDHVIYGKYSGNEVKVDGIEYKIMRVDEVLAKFE